MNDVSFKSYGSIAMSYFKDAFAKFISPHCFYYNSFPQPIVIYKGCMVLKNKSDRKYEKCWPSIYLLRKTKQNQDNKF